MRGTEMYDPPYGYLGIGLNVKDKYDNGNDEWLTDNSTGWAIAYYSISSKLSSDIIKKLLNYIITKDGLKKEFLILKENQMIKEIGEKLVKVFIKHLVLKMLKNIQE